MRQRAMAEVAAEGANCGAEWRRISRFDARAKRSYPSGMAETSEETPLSSAVVAAILDAARRHGMEAPRVFGSVVTGTSRPDSDLDLLVRLGPGRGYSDLLAFCDELEADLGRKVDVLTEDALNPFLHRGILAEAIAL
jgi:predicted nucleotidyltransferase